MLSDEIEQSPGCRKHMKRVLSEMPKPLMRLGLVSLNAPTYFFSDMVLPEGRSKPAKYNRISWHDKEKLSGI